MPPKRKRAEATDAAPRATRASSRRKTSADATGDAPTADTTRKGTVAGVGEGIQAEPVAKKPKKATGKAAATKGGKGVVQVQQTNACNGAAPEPTKTEARKQPAKPEPYSDSRARKLFKTYEDPDTPGEIGPEGFEKLCGDLEISLEGALPLVLAWQLHATEMAKFKESEWMQGTSELRASDLPTLSLALHDLEDLLFLDKPAAQLIPSTPSKKKGAPALSNLSDPYNRGKYNQYAADKDKAFRDLYGFCFMLAKPPVGRNIDMDTASAFWSVLLAPKYPLMNDVLAFIAEKGSYKGVNKDVWSMVLDFAKTVQSDLLNYDPDGAWPTMLDDFVAWKKAKDNAVEVNVDDS